MFTTNILRKIRTYVLQFPCQILSELLGYYAVVSENIEF